MKTFVGLLAAILAVVLAQSPRNATSLSAGETTHGPDVPPVAANAMDDEFNDSAFNSSKWTWVNQNGSSVSETGKGYLEFVGVTQVSTTPAIFQALPSPPYKFTTHLACGGAEAGAGSLGCGIELRESATNKIELLNIYPNGSNGTTFNTSVYTLTSDVVHSGGAVVFGDVTWPCGNAGYFRVGRSGSSLTFEVSCDGAPDSFWNLGTSALTDHFTTAPDQIAIEADTVVSDSAYGIFYWFRRTT